MSSHNVRKRLNDALSTVHAMSVTQPAAYAQLSLPLPGLHISSFGDISIPLTVPVIQQLISSVVSTQAPFGKGSATVVDTSVRNCQQIDATNIQLSHRFSNAVVSLAYDLCIKLGIPAISARHVRPHLYKLVLYPTGGFFKLHRDTEKEQGMFGTLVLQLPSQYTGGTLQVFHANRVLQFDMTKEVKETFHAVAFYADVQHELLPVTSGTRICLLYNLCMEYASQQPGSVGPPLPSLNGLDNIIRSIVNIANHWEREHHDNLNNINQQNVRNKTSMLKVVVPCEHKYTETNLSFRGLKGRDATIVQVLHRAYKFDLRLALLEKHEVGCCEYDGYNNHGEHVMDDVIDSSIKVLKWVSIKDERATSKASPVSTSLSSEHNKPYANFNMCNAQRVQPNNDIIDVDVSDDDHENNDDDVSKSEIDGLGNTLSFDGTNCDTLDGEPLFNEDMKPDREDYEGYTGNAGPSLEYWYHRAVIVFWLKSSAVHIMCDAAFPAAVQLAARRAADTTQPAFAIDTLRQVVAYAERNIAKCKTRLSTLLEVTCSLRAFDACVRVLQLMVKTDAIGDAGASNHGMQSPYSWRLNMKADWRTRYIGVASSTHAQAIAKVVATFGWKDDNEDGGGGGGVSGDEIKRGEIQEKQLEEKKEEHKTLREAIVNCVIETPQDALEHCAHLALLLRKQQHHSYQQQNDKDNKSTTPRERGDIEGNDKQTVPVRSVFTNGQSSNTGVKMSNAAKTIATLTASRAFDNVNTASISMSFPASAASRIARMLFAFGDVTHEYRQAFFKVAHTLSTSVISDVIHDVHDEMYAGIKQRRSGSVAPILQARSVSSTEGAATFNTKVNETELSNDSRFAPGFDALIHAYLHNAFGLPLNNPSNGSSTPVTSSVSSPALNFPSVSPLQSVSDDRISLFHSNTHRLQSFMGGRFGSGADTEEEAMVSCHLAVWLILFGPLPFDATLLSDFCTGVLTIDEVKKSGTLLSALLQHAKVKSLGQSSCPVSVKRAQQLAVQRLAKARLAQLVASSDLSSATRMANRQPEAYIPGHARVTEFLRGDSIQMTYTGVFSGIAHARNFANKHFNGTFHPMEKHSATANEGGRGQNAFVVIHKTDGVLKRRLAQVKKDQRELEYVQRLLRDITKNISSGDHQVQNQNQNVPSGNNNSRNTKDLYVNQKGVAKKEDKHFQVQNISSQQQQAQKNTIENVTPPSSTLRSPQLLVTSLPPPNIQMQQQQKQPQTQLSSHHGQHQHQNQTSMPAVVGMSMPIRTPSALGMLPPATISMSAPPPPPASVTLPSAMRPPPPLISNIGVAVPSPSVSQSPSQSAQPLPPVNMTMNTMHANNNFQEASAGANTGFNNVMAVDNATSNTTDEQSATGAAGNQNGVHWKPV